jgi:hypothetical protein
MVAAHHDALGHTPHRLVPPERQNAVAKGMTDRGRSGKVPMSVPAAASHSRPVMSEHTEEHSAELRDVASTAATSGHVTSDE